MKIAESSIPSVESVGENKTHEFTIKASSKAFHILSKGIYGDSITPPIRELATNAWDSHIEAKKRGMPCDRPFEVHLPTHMEPWFSVRDYGVGMDSDDLTKVYTTYFESTKIQSNDYTGCLGLGSKSPFCYADVFTVESYCNGKRYVAVCSVNNGIPQFSLMSTEDSDKPSGVLVKFAVEAKDFNTFKRTAQTVYSRFQNRPKVVNDNSFTFEEPEVLRSGTGWKVLKKCDIGSHAIMGNIAYPIRLSNVVKDTAELDDEDPYSVKNLMEALLESNISIRFEIGQLEIAANRESLHFDNRTRKNIQLALKNIFNELVDEFVSELRKEKSLWNQICKWDQMSKAFNQSQGYYYSGASKLFRAIEECPRVKREFGSSLSQSSIDVKIDILGLDEDEEFEIVSYEYKPSLISKSKRATGTTIRCNTKNKLVHIDSQKSFVGRIKQYIIDNGGNVDRMYVLPTDDVDRKKILDKLGYPESKVIKTSDLRVPDRTSTASSSRKKTSRTVLKYRGMQSTWNNSYNWMDTMIEDITEGPFYYVEVSRNYIVSQSPTGKSVSFSDLEILITEGKRMGILSSSFVLYGIPSHKLDGIKKAAPDEWDHFPDYMSERITEYFCKIPDIANKVKTHKQISGGNSSEVIEQIGRFASMIRLLGVDNEIPKIFHSLIAMKNKFLKSVASDKLELDLYTKFCNHGVNIDLTNASATGTYDVTAKDLSDTFNIILSRYPMIRILGPHFDYSAKESAGEIYNYIKLVDQKRV